MPFQILLSLCFCFSLSVHVSALYSRMVNTSTSYMSVFVALLSSLEFHTFPSACQVPLANPILLSTSLSVLSCVLMIPPRYTKLCVCEQSTVTYCKSLLHLCQKGYFFSNKRKLD